MDLTWLAPIAAAWALLMPSAVAAALIEPPTDYTGVALVVTAAGAFLATVIGAVFTGVLALRASRRSESAEIKSEAATAASIAATAAAVAAKDQSIETAKAVDGKMTEVVKLVTEKVAAEATLAEKEAEAARKAAVALGVKEEMKAAPTLAVAMTAGTNGSDAAKAVAVLAEAAIQAEKLLEAAAVTAAALLVKAQQDAKK